jgi:hypothetical protein
VLGIIHALNMHLKGISIGKSHSATAFDNFVLEASTANGTMFRIDPVATSKTHVGRVKIDFGTSIARELSDLLSPISPPATSTARFVAAMPS